MFVHPKTPSPQKHSKLQSVRVKRPLENHPIAATHNAEEEFAAEDAVAAAQPELSVSNSDLYGIGFGNIERIGLSEASMQISYNHEPVPLAQATRVDVTGSNTSHPITANPISAETAAKKGDAFVASEKVFDCKSKFKPSNHLILLLDLSPSMAKNSNATKGKLFDSCVDSTQPEIDQQGNEDYDYNPMDNATNATNATIATVQASSSRNCNVDCSSGCDGLRSMLSKDGLRKFLKDKYSDSGYGRLLISGFSGKVAYVDGCHMRGNIIGVQNDNSAQHGAYEQELAKCALQKSVPLDDGQAIDKLCEAWIEKVSKMDSVIRSTARMLHEYCTNAARILHECCMTMQHDAFVHVPAMTIHNAPFTGAGRPPRAWRRNELRECDQVCIRSVSAPAHARSWQ